MAKVIEPVAQLSIRLLRSQGILLSANANRQRDLRWTQQTIQNVHAQVTTLHCRAFSVTASLNATPYKGKKKKQSPKLSDDPEKVKRAVQLKELHRSNKEMFGELLETRQEKSKRIKKEKKKPKLLDVSNQNDFLVDPILDPVAAQDSAERSIKSPKSLPMSEKSTARGTSTKVTGEGEKKETAKDAEFNWAMRFSPNMLRVIRGNYSHEDLGHGKSDAVTTDPSKGLFVGQVEDELLTGKGSSPDASDSDISDETAEKKRRGSSTQGQSDPGMGLSVRQRNQFMKSLFDCQDFQPRCEVRKVRQTKEDVPEEEKNSAKISHQDNRLMHKGNEAPIDSTFTSGQNDNPDSDQAKTFSQESKIIPAISTENEEIGKDSTSQEYKADNGVNVCNQQSPSIIVSVPYFNPEREKSAPSEKSQDSYLDQDQIETYVRTDNFDSNGGRQAIISIPFPRNSASPYNAQDGNHFDTKTKPASSPRYPSVSKILNATMPPEQVQALERWQKKMVAEMGEEGFRVYKENMLNNGKMLHSNIEAFFRGTPVSEILVADSITGHWDSLQRILPAVDDVFALESHVVHPKLQYCGIVDCVAVFKKKLVVIDWKTSQKQKPVVSMTYDTPLQIAAYVGAINYDPNYSIKVDGGLIVIAYEDGRPGHTFLLKPDDIAGYWNKWVRRLNAYKALTNSKNTV